MSLADRLLVSSRISLDAVDGIYFIISSLVKESTNIKNIKHKANHDEGFKVMDGKVLKKVTVVWPRNLQ